MNYENKIRVRKDSFDLIALKGKIFRDTGIQLEISSDSWWDFMPGSTPLLVHPQNILVDNEGTYSIKPIANEELYTFAYFGKQRDVTIQYSTVVKKVKEMEEYMKKCDDEKEN